MKYLTSNIRTLYVLCTRLLLRLRSYALRAIVYIARSAYDRRSLAIATNYFSQAVKRHLCIIPIYIDPPIKGRTSSDKYLHLPSK